MLGIPAVMSERLITISLMTTGALSDPVFRFSLAFLGLLPFSWFPVSVFSVLFYRLGFGAELTCWIC